MKELNGSREVAAPLQPTEDSAKIPLVTSTLPAQQMRHTQAATRPSQAQLRAQVMSSLRKEVVNTSVRQGEQVNIAQGEEQVVVPTIAEQSTDKEGSVPSAEVAESVNVVEKTEEGPSRPANLEEKSAGTARQEEVMKVEEAGKGLERKNSALQKVFNGVAFGKKPDKPRVVPLQVDLPEEVVFKPVDLDQKYREKELIKHVTAAKIQNREEALLNNPGSPTVNGRYFVASHKITEESTVVSSFQFPAYGLDEWYGMGLYSRSVGLL
jgi:hypothetical protein